MRHRLLSLALAAILAHAEEALSQEVPKARLWDDCDSVCFTLSESVRLQPETAVMRLEDALVIRRQCAAEIVSTALNAAGSNRALREKLLQTALRVAPEMSRNILAAARNPVRAAPARPIDEEALLAAAAPQEVVQRAIIPEIEVRRAALPGEAIELPVSEPEVRRAIRLAPQQLEEVRQAEMARAGMPRLNLTRRRR